MSADPKPIIDRQSTTPFLLKLFYRSSGSGFHTLSNFPIASPASPTPQLPSHLQIYTWPSCTLRELAHLLTTALPSLLPDPAVGTRLSFRLVFPDTRPPPPGRGGVGGLGGRDDARGRYVTKEMGSVVVAPQMDEDDDAGYRNGDTSIARAVKVEGDDADKTLADVRFVIGDFIDCAVFPPLGDGSVAPRPSATGGLSRGAGFGRGGAGYPPREDGYGRSRGGGIGSLSGGGGRGGFGTGRGDFSGGNIPSGEWRRGERLPESGYSGYGGGRARGRGSY